MATFPYLIPPYSGFTQMTPTIPKFYWDVNSQEQRIKTICVLLQKVIDYSDEVAKQTNANTAEMDALRKLFDKFQESGFDDYYRKQIEEWVERNLWSLYQTFCKQLLFGLTDDGYFCAYVPEGWDDIEFDTGAVFDNQNYGRLILRYDVDGSGVIDNTGYGPITVGNTNGD